MDLHDYIEMLRVHGEHLREVFGAHNIRYQSHVHTPAREGYCRQCGLPGGACLRGHVRMRTPPPVRDSAAMNAWGQARNAPYLEVITALTDAAFTTIQLPTSMAYTRLLWSEAHRRVGQAAAHLTYTSPREAAKEEPAPSAPSPEPPKRRVTRAEWLMADWL